MDPKRSIRVGSAFVLASGLMLVPTLGRTAEVSEVRDVAPNAANVVVFDIEGQDDPSLRSTVDELFGRIGLSLRPEGEVAESSVLARVRVERNEDGVAIVVHTSNGRPARRQVARAGQSDALFRETVAHVILGSVEPLTAPEPKAPEKSVPPASIANAEAPAPTSAPFELVVGARGGVLGWGSGAVSALVLGEVGLRGAGTLRPTVSFQGGAALPVRVESGSSSADLSALRLRLSAGLEPLHSGRAALGLSVGAGADVVRFSPSVRDPFASDIADSARAQPVLSPAISGRYRLASRLDVLLTAGADLDLAPRRWVVTTPFDKMTLFELGRVRPFVTLGFDIVATRPISDDTGAR